MRYAVAVRKYSTRLCVARTRWPTFDLAITCLGTRSEAQIEHSRTVIVQLCKKLVLPAPLPIHVLELAHYCVQILSRYQ